MAETFTREERDREIQKIRKDVEADMRKELLPKVKEKMLEQIRQEYRDELAKMLQTRLNRLVPVMNRFTVAGRESLQDKESTQMSEIANEFSVILDKKNKLTVIGLISSMTFWMIGHHVRPRVNPNGNLAEFNIVKPMSKDADSAEKVGDHR